ncbi:MAG: transaldolase [Candidatus Binatia bacterium]
MTATLTRSRPSGENRIRRDGALRIALFADGANAAEMLAEYRSGQVQGFTTNPTLMRQSGVTDYVGFAREVLAEICDLPISFEVFADEFSEMERQARIIASWGPNVVVKIPITNTRGESSLSVVSALSRSGIKLNVTALLAVDQVRDACEALSPDVPAIVSVFAGRIADTGRDPVPIMREAVQVAQRRPLVQILWASPREVLNVYQAEECGCHIITATKPVLDKLKLRGKDLHELSRATVQMFYDDARRAGYTL